MNDNIFEAVKIRTVWFDITGLLRAIAPSPKKEQKGKLRKLGAAVFFITATVAGMNAVSAAMIPRVPTQLALDWPTPPTAQNTKQSLLEALGKIRRLRADWVGHEIAAPDDRSIIATERIVAQLPNVVAEATAGVDAEGHVYVRLKKGERQAYVTVEPTLVHLLYMEPGQPTVYVDNEKFKGKVLPANIRHLLATKLA